MQEEILSGIDTIQLYQTGYAVIITLVVIIFSYIYIKNIDNLNILEPGLTEVNLIVDEANIEELQLANAIASFTDISSNLNQTGYYRFSQLLSDISQVNSEFEEYSSTYGLS